MIVVDVEASGTNPHKHSILSIGAVNLHDPSQFFYDECSIWSGAHIDSDALAVNGFQESEITNTSRPTEAELMEGFITWAMDQDEHTFAGINPLFDIEFIKAATGRAGLNYPFANRSIDLHSIVYFLHVEAGILPPTVNQHTDVDSDYIMNYVGIPPEPHPHNALNGALWESEALYRLITKEPLFDQFDQYPVPLF